MMPNWLTIIRRSPLSPCVGQINLTETRNQL